jgi:hypothetical protein
MQRAWAVLYCHLWPVRLYHILPHYLINDTVFIQLLNKNMCFDFLYDFCPKYISFQKQFSEVLTKMYIRIHVKYPLFLSFSMKLESSRQIFEKYSNIKFHKNPSSECGRTDTHSGMMKLIVAFS